MPHYSCHQQLRLCGNKRQQTFIRGCRGFPGGPNFDDIWSPFSPNSQTDIKEVYVIRIFGCCAQGGKKFFGFGTWFQIKCR